MILNITLEVLDSIKVNTLKLALKNAGNKAAEQYMAMKVGETKDLKQGERDLFENVDAVSLWRSV